jgi:hypothetical protein
MASPAAQSSLALQPVAQGDIQFVAQGAIARMLRRYCRALI